MSSQFLRDLWTKLESCSLRIIRLLCNVVFSGGRAQNSLYICFLLRRFTLHLAECKPPSPCVQSEAGGPPLVLAPNGDRFPCVTKGNRLQEETGHLLLRSRYRALPTQYSCSHLLSKSAGKPYLYHRSFNFCQTGY